MQRQGICLSYNGSLKLLDVIGGHYNEKLIDLLMQKRRFRLIGDNINWTVDVHDQRMGHSSHMEHAFGSAILVQNLDFSVLTNTYPQRNFEETPCQQFIPGVQDFTSIRRDYVVLMTRVACKFLPYFEMFQDCVPHQLSQPIDPKLTMKTEVIPLPVLFKNEQKYQDVVEILDFYEKIITNACTGAQVPVDNIRVHIGGDQLTRERFSGAKCLRAHEDSPTARFEHLSPITFEFFHLNMNILQMAYTILFKDGSAQDLGTMKSLQNRISRTVVNANVNAHYDADKDFFISIVDVYIAELFMEHFGMEDANSRPTKNLPPEFTCDEEKQQWYMETVGGMVDEYIFAQEQEPVEGIYYTCI